MDQHPIASEKIVNERKIFFLDLKENQRGRFLKITEDVGGRRDTIMLSAGRSCAPFAGRSYSFASNSISRSSASRKSLKAEAGSMIVSRRPPTSSVILRNLPR